MDAASNAVIPDAPARLDDALLATLSKPTVKSSEELDAERQKALRLFSTGYAIDMAGWNVEEDDPNDVPITRQVLAEQSGRRTS